MFLPWINKLETVNKLRNHHVGKNWNNTNTKSGIDEYTNK